MTREKRRFSRAIRAGGDTPDVDPHDRRAAAWELLAHLDTHGPHLERLDDAEAHLHPDGQTSRSRRALLRPLTPDEPAPR